jgi:hypothetical protein
LIAHAHNLVRNIGQVVIQFKENLVRLASAAPRRLSLGMTIGQASHDQDFCLLDRSKGYRYDC